MNVKTAVFLATTSIKRGSKGTLAMTILIMTLAYVNLVFVSSIFGGIVDAINNEAIYNQYSNILIESADDEQYIKNKNAIQQINQIEGVVAVSPHYINSAIVKHDEFMDGRDINSGRWSVKSMNPELEKKVTKISNSMVNGEFLSSTDRNKVILGKEVAGGYGGSLDHLSLMADVGDDIDISYTNGVTRKYTVKGVFSTKSTQADQMIFVTQDEMESVLGVHGWASEILVKTDKIGGEEKYVSQIRALGLKDESIKIWSDLMGFTAGASDSFVMISIILGVIGTIVAGVTIFIIIFVSVVNKRRQIGILKAIGMRENTIILYFVLQALFYGIVGVILGASLILFVIRPLFIANPLDFPVGWVSLKVTFNIIQISNFSLIGAALIGGFFPARSGAKESILKSIWG